MKTILMHAAEFITSGNLVIFPSETVYGIGADATNESACQKIFAAKGRPSHNPLIVHVANIAQAKAIAIFNDRAEILAQLWPGPLTLVLPLQPNHNIAPCVTAGLPTVAIRIPAHEVALDLINSTGLPIAAPSANLSGALSATILKQVRKSFRQNKDIYILDHPTECKIGLESTIIDLSTSDPIILRQGYFTEEFLSDYLGVEMQVANENSEIKAPGMLLKHYAPKTPVRLNATFLLDNTPPQKLVSEEQVQEAYGAKKTNIHKVHEDLSTKSDEAIALSRVEFTKGAKELGLNFANSHLNSHFSLNLSPRGDLIEAAANLYYYLYQLDEYAQQNNYTCIAVAPVPNHNIGAAINDRLKKASSGA